MYSTPIIYTQLQGKWTSKQMKISNLFIPLYSSLLLMSCTSTAEQENRTNDDKSIVGTAITKTEGGINDAALQPLTDLNLRRETIPKLLKDLSTPYEAVAVGCDVISNEVVQLNAILGPDYDHSLEIEETTLKQEAGEEAADFTLDTVRGLTTDSIPFRSLVRRATGAKKHDKKVRKAYELGLKRRAYLKGIGHERHCLPPAAPFAYEKQITQSPIEYKKVKPDQ